MAKIKAWFFQTKAISINSDQSILHPFMTRDLLTIIILIRNKKEISAGGTEMRPNS